MDRTGRKRTRRGSTETESGRFGGSRLRLLGVAVLCLKLGLVPLVFDQSADVPFVVPKALLSHGLTYVLIAILLGLFIQNGPSFLVRSWVHVPVLAFLVVSVLATAFAVNPTLALFGAHVRMLGLTTIADEVITYFAVVHFVRQRRDVIAVIASIFAASAVVVAYEIVQWAGQDPVHWLGSDSSQRPFSTLGQPTSLGEYLGTLSIVAFALAGLSRGLGVPARALLAAYSLVLLVFAGVTGTRSAAVGVAAAAGTFVVVIWVKHPSRKVRALGVVGAAGAGVALAVVLMLTPLGPRLLSTVVPATGEPTGLGLEESAAVRVGIYGIAAQMVRERPILGYGPDSLAAGVPTYRPAPAPGEIRESSVTSAHSWVGYVATSTGLLGLTAFIAVVVLAAFIVIRRPVHPIGLAAGLGVVAYLGSGLTTINSLEIDTLFWVAIAAVVCASTTVPPVGTGESARRGRRPVRSGATSARWISWGVVVVGGALLFTTLPALEASRLAKDSVSARTSTTAAQAIDLATRATQLDPNRAEYWEQLALSNVTAARWPDASRAFKKAAEIAPYDIRFLNDDIQIQLLLASRGDAAASTEALRLAQRAVQIDPHNPLAWWNKGRAEFARHDLMAAVTSMDRALAVQPNGTDSFLLTAVEIYVTAAQSYRTTGDLDGALRVAQDGVAAVGARTVSVAIRLEYARALAANNQLSEALAEIDAALKLVPNNEAALTLRIQLRGR